MEYSLVRFRDFINSLPDELFPDGKRYKEQAIDASALTDEELIQRIIRIISDYPSTNTYEYGPRVNAIYQKTGTLKYKERTRNLLQKIFESGVAAPSNDGRWYIAETANKEYEEQFKNWPPE